MTRRLVEFYRPARIYLFGSEARDEAGPDSDLDFLVVVPDDTPESTMRNAEAYSRLSGLGMPKDVRRASGVSDVHRRGPVPRGDHRRLVSGPGGTGSAGGDAYLCQRSARRVAEGVAWGRGGGGLAAEPAEGHF